MQNCRIPGLVILLWGLTSIAWSQEKQLSLYEIVLKDDLNPAKLNQLNWFSGTDEYYYISEDREALIGGTPAEEEKTWVQLVELNEKLPARIDRIQQFPDITHTDGKTIYFRHDNKIWSFSLESRRLIMLNRYPDGLQAIEISKSGKLAFVKDHNLFFSGDQSSEVRQLTFDGSNDIVYGQTVHRNEFGISKGLYWSPDQKRFAFYRMDQSMVAAYPLVNYQIIPAEVSYLRYPMTGQTSHQVKVGVYDIETDKIIYLKTGLPEDKYLTNITWSPDSKSLYLAQVNRDQNQMQLNRYNLESGALEKNLFIENDSVYVEPENGPIFLPDQPDQFLWFSERNGFNQLYLYNTEGKLLEELTSEKADVTEFLGFGESSRAVYYTSTLADPLERHVYRTNLRKPKAVKITSDPGVHQAKLSGSGQYLIDDFSSRTIPGITRIISGRNGSVVKMLLESPDPLQNYQLGTTEIFTLKDREGGNLYARLIKPPGFDPASKYPVIIYVYGGPHVQLLRNEWLAGAKLFYHYLARQGFLVFSLDNRGSIDRGKAFEQATFRELGKVELEDQMTGVNHLKSLAYVDTSRLGVHGWSFGGFMTLSMMLKNPGVFKAAVAGGSVIDWKLYEVMYTERYMDTPEANPKGYERANLLNYVKNVNGKILLIHNLLDPVVVPQHAELFLQKCIELNKQVDFFNYPGHEHNVRGRDRVHLLENISKYFLEHL